MEIPNDPIVRRKHTLGRPSALATLFMLASVFGLAQRSDVSKDYPIYRNGCLPDLRVDPQRFVAQMQIVDRYFALDDFGSPKA